MNKHFFCLLFLFCIGVNFAQQKKTLTHDDYDLWKHIAEVKTSKDGQIVATTVSTTTDRGDGYLKIYNTRTGNSSDFHNGYKANISVDGNYIFFLRKPDYELTRQEKKDEVKKEEQTKDVLFIYDVKNNSIYDSIPGVKSYEVPKEESGWVVIEKFKEQKPKKDSTAVKSEKSADTSSVKKKKNPAFEEDYALVYNLQNKRKDTIFKLKAYQLPEEGKTFYFSTTKGEKKGDFGIFQYNVRNNERKAIDTGRFAYEKLAVDKKGNQLAYLSAKDSTENDSLKYELFYFNKNELSKITDTLGKNLNENWELSNAQSPYFSKNGKRLYFYSRPERNFDVDTTLLKEEVPEVDVWSYQDKLIQPEQKAKLKELSDRAYLSFYNPEKNKVISLHDGALEYVILDKDAEQRYILGYTNSPYDVSRSWEYPWSSDYYIIDTQTGNKKLALEGASGTPYLAPNGTHAIYFDVNTGNWWSQDLSSAETKNLTSGLGVAFFDEENDVPADPGAYGFGGFTENMEALLYDQFDIWRVDLAKDAAPVKITKNGRESNLQFRTLRLDRENRDQASYLNGRLLVTAFDKNFKSSSVFALNMKNGKFQPLIETEDMLLSGFHKPEDAEMLLYRKQNFRNYPDLFLYRSKRDAENRITNVNKQQEEFKWGTAELFSWTSYDSIPLQGIVYKPDNFDPNKKYPLITYFYEKRSDNLHSYSSPQPSASIVNMPYLVSNDYVVFVPDIVYKEGKPGESAYNSIVAGVEALEKEGYIDSENMAIQGQSWGGYQVAHLITVTDKFKAAMAGAPVANMTSAYGGIRWQTGLSRAFQYEKTQSRIGKNLWEGLDLYMENSPLFGIPNIDTPLLMMHNDADGAVPYYQGIEMFMGMRRLNKPVWLLVYNNEGHNLTKVKNKQDLSIRMMQFFDHYLKDEPAPVWMTEGVPAVMKGKDLQYDLEGK